MRYARHMGPVAQVTPLACAHGVPYSRRVGGEIKISQTHDIVTRRIQITLCMSRRLRRIKHTVPSGGRYKPDSEMTSCKHTTAPFLGQILKYLGRTGCPVISWKPCFGMLCSAFFRVKRRSDIVTIAHAMRKDDYFHQSFRDEG